MLGPRAWHALAYGATAIALATIVVLWVVPGYWATACVPVTSDGRAYCGVSVTLVQPPPCSSPYCPSLPVAAPVDVPVGPMVFHLYFGGGSDGVGLIHGTLSGSAREPVPFSLLGDPLGPPSVNWTSPGGAAIIVWSAPFLTNTSDGGFSATVTCGVTLPVEASL
jgi:hypothetical protein